MIWFVSLILLISQGTTLETVSIGWYGVVDVNFGTAYGEQNEMYDPPQVFLSLSTNETGLSLNSYWFEQYNCLSPYCAPNDNGTVNLSTVDIVCQNGTRGTPILELNETAYWKLETSAVLLNGPGFRHYSRHSDVYGFIGLGADGNASSNFAGGEITFSIYLATSTYGQLIFGYDASLADTSKSTMVLSSDANWNVNVSSVTFGTATNTKSVKMIFDLYRGQMSDPSILLPSSYYDSVVSILTQIQGVNSSQDGSSSGYLFTGSLTALPDFIINVSDGSTLTLTPYLYTNSTQDDNAPHKILFGKSEDSLPPNNTDYIVLGWDVLSKVYPVFERKNNTSTISIYSRYTSPDDTTTSNTPTAPSKNNLWIVFLILVIILAIAVVIYARRLRAKKREIEEVLNEKAIRI